MEYLAVKAENPDWSRIPSVTLTHTGWLTPCAVCARAQLCHDERFLYVRMEAVEAPIRAVLEDPMAQVCEDCCLVFFLAPLADDPRYFNFEFNPLGNSYIGFGRQRMTRCRLFPADMDAFRIAPFRTEDGWGVSFAVPLSFLQMYLPEFSFSGQSACNFYKCGEQTAVPHYLSWAPMTCSQPDFHRVQDFGSLTFG